MQSQERVIQHSQQSGEQGESSAIQQTSQNDEQDDASSLVSKFTNIYVKNFPHSISDEQLEEIFDGFGRISSAVVMKDDLGLSKGFGFVNLERADDAAQAVADMNGTMVGPNSLYVERAQKESERATELAGKLGQDFCMGPLSEYTPSMAALPLYHPGAPRMPMPLFNGPPAAACISPQLAGYGYQLALSPAIGSEASSVQGTLYFVPVAQSREVYQKGGPGALHQQQEDQQQRFIHWDQRAKNAQKQALELELYLLVDAMKREHARKITGMLLESSYEVGKGEVSVLIKLIKSPSALKRSVAAALSLLAGETAGDHDGVSIAP